MAKKNDADSADKKKGAKKNAGAGAKKGSAARKGSTPEAKKGGASDKTGSRGSGRRDGPATVEDLITSGMLVEKSKHPLSYLIGTRTPVNEESIWLCWPEGSISLDDICGSEYGVVVLIEKSKGGGP